MWLIRWTPPTRPPCPCWTPVAQCIKDRQRRRWTDEEDLELSLSHSQKSQKLTRRWRKRIWQNPRMNIRDATLLLRGEHPLSFTDHILVENQRRSPGGIIKRNSQLTKTNSWNVVGEDCLEVRAHRRLSSSLLMTRASLWILWMKI